jgi:hypothetical protein
LICDVSGEVGGSIPDAALNLYEAWTATPGPPFIKRTFRDLQQVGSFANRKQMVGRPRRTSGNILSLAHCRHPFWKTMPPLSASALEWQLTSDNSN